MNAIIPVPMLGGVDLLRDAKRISPFALTKSQNLVPTRAGFMTTRKGTDWFCNILNDSYLPINLMFPPFQDAFAILTTRNALLVTDDTPAAPPAAGYGVINNTIIHVVPNPDGAFGDSSFHWFDMGAVTPIRPAQVVFRNKVYFFAGPAANACIVQIMAPDASPTRFVFNGTDNALLPFVACSYRQRMCYFNFGAGFECSGIFSNNNDPATIGNSALGTREFTFGAKDGDRVVAAVEVTQTGAAAESMLLILKEMSAYFMTGEPNQTTDPAAISLLNDAQVMRSPVDCGCSSAQSVVNTPYGVIWAGPDDVWLFVQGQQPRRVGTKIRERLKLTGPTFRYLWHAAYFDGFYRLAIASPEQAPWMTDDAKMEEQWWLDLRDGAPQSSDDARWYGPMKYKIANRPSFLASIDEGYWSGGTRCMAIDSRPGKQNALYGAEAIQANIATGHGGARFVAMFAYDSDQPYDSCLDYSPGVGTFHRSDVINNEADIAVWTKDYAAVGFNGEQTQDDPMVEKLMLGAEFAAWVSDYCRISLDLVLDGGRKVATYHRDVATKGFITSVDTLDAGPVTEEFQAIALSAGSDRQQGKYYQAKLYVTPGFVIGPLNNTFGFIDIDDGGTNTLLVATLAQGFYADLKALADALVAALHVASPSGLIFTHNIVSAIDGRNVVVITGSSDWSPVFLQDALAVGVPTAAQAHSTRQIGAYFGLDTGAGVGEDPNWTAVSSVPYKLNPKVEIGQLNLKVRPNRRRPL